ncbi:MAG TPA: L-threonylcarbamoyladenylate synthase [Acidiphilium sp.]|nr:L-threonylcarbamoyladenylate synthase [Acidiphilium sp.]
MTERLAADAAGIARAATLLTSGHLVAFATETVYGLGADATNAAAVAAIYEAKGRPRFNPLISHVPDADAAFRHALADARAERVAAAFWPGPLTLVLPRRAESDIAALATAGLDSLAVRVPGHPVARALLAAVGRPVAAPSANLSGRLSPTRPAHVLAGLEGRIAGILESGSCAVGLESTILDLTGPHATILRPGGIAREAMEAVIGPVDLAGGSGDDVKAPGMLASHYAPVLSLRLGAAAPEADEAWLGFGPVPGAAAVARNLSPAGDLVEAAARLFDALHELDEAAIAAGLARIAVAPVPARGLGIAINDRLARAAAPRGGAQSTFR